MAKNDSKNQTITVELTASPVKKVTYNNIVPDELQMELLDLRDSIRTSSFKIGDIAWKVMSQAVDRGIDVSQSMVWAAVGSFVGYSARTIRYFAETSEFYPKDVREKYDILPFSHFVYARYKGDRWEQVLEHAMSNPGMTEAELDYWYRTDVLGHKMTPGVVDTIASLPLANKAVPTLSPQPQPSDLLIVLSDVVLKAEQLLESMDGESGVIQDIALHVGAIKQLLPKLRVKVRV